MFQLSLSVQHDFSLILYTLRLILLKKSEHPLSEFDFIKEGAGAVRRLYETDLKGVDIL